MGTKKWIIIKRKKNDFVTDELIKRFNQLLRRKTLSVSVDVHIFCESSQQELTGNILLISPALMKELPTINRLTRNFSFAAFIDPYAYANIDENKLLNQIQGISQLGYEELASFRPKNYWLYPDYFMAMTNMMKSIRQ